MKEIIGDFWEHANGYQGLVCTINQRKNSKDNLVMGAGIAKEFAHRFPYLPYVWGKELLYRRILISYGCMKTIREYKQEFFLLGVPTKIHWKSKSNLDFVVESCKKLVVCCNDLAESGLRSVLMPRPGCGKGGLDWKEVRKRISLFLDDRFTVIEKEK